MNPTHQETTTRNDAAAPPADDPLGRAHRFVVELGRLAGERAALESSIEAQYLAAKKSAERTDAESRLAINQNIETERRDAETDYAEMRQHALSRFELESASIKREFTELRQQMVAEYNDARREAKQKRKDTRWEAETLYEAAKDLPPRQLQEFHGKLDVLLARVRAERDEARDRLIHWRQAVDEVAPADSAPPIESGDFLALVQERANLVAEQQLRLAALRVPPLVAQFAVVWYLVLAGLVLAGLAWFAAGPWGAGPVLAVAVVAGLALHFYLARRARTQIAAIYPPIVRAAEEAEALGQSALAEARALALAQAQELVEKRDRALSAAEQAYQQRREEIKAQREARFQQMSEEYPQRMAAIAACRDRDLGLAEQHRARHEAEIQRHERDEPKLRERYERALVNIEQRTADRRAEMAEEWRGCMARTQLLADDLMGRGEGDRWLADWNSIAGGRWRPAADLPAGLRFGEFRVAMDQIPQGLPTSLELAQMTPDGFSLPALLSFAEQPSMLFTAAGSLRRTAIEAMQAVMLRLLVTLPPGKPRFTIIDPVGLGENFAAFMHLADFNEALITSRIWTEPQHIEQRLADLAEHMENVIQKYLRNEYETIDQYNREAGEIAEPMRFLVIADFPANFSEAAQRRLRSIVANGGRCGVYTLIMADTQLEAPAEISLGEIEAHATTLVARGGRFTWRDKRFGQFELALDRAPPAHQVTEILQAAGRYAADAARVEVPFEAIVPAANAFWTSSAKSGIDVPLGRVGATRLQSMRLGHGTSQHVLVAGKTGSGKSTLWHALVTNLSLRYSPDEVELYLIDFKQGVEFKAYATQRLPHARVVAIESDREFGVSVLARLDQELKTRADRFRDLGVQDLAGYREADPKQPLPRILLVIDEFQEFFVEDDKVSQEAALLLDRLVRQGRAFGIHVLLGTQTLAGAYSLARSTIGQMAVRVALQCSETDAHLILSEDNSAARLLSRPGEAIYNDSNGLVEGNHPFQIVWLPDERREVYLEKIRALAATNGVAPRGQIVFEGNLPADPARNVELAHLLATGVTESAPARAWLGEAVAIKEPTAAVFRPQSGCNLLLVGQNEDAALGALAMAAISLSAHRRSGTSAARFYVLDGSVPNSTHGAALERLARVACNASLVGRRELPRIVNELAVEVERRQAAGDAHDPPIYVLVYGVHKLRDLRRDEEDFGFGRSDPDRPPDPAKQFITVLREGPAVSVHVLTWCDSVNNLQRTWDRQTLREFEMRVAFQMNSNDSSTLIDVPLAAKLGANRAWFASEESGVLEKFRPYRWPSDEWLETVERQLHGANSSDPR